jgi:transposase
MNRRRGSPECAQGRGGRLGSAFDGRLSLIANDRALDVEKASDGRFSSDPDAIYEYEQWVKLEPLLPRGKKSGRPPRHPRRQLIDGIQFRVRTGVQWRDLPARYGPWQTVYGLFRRWQRDGTWKRILTQLQAQADAEGLTITGSADRGAG